MATNVSVAEWPLKDGTMVATTEKNKATINLRKYLIVTIGCFIASLVSAAIATYLYYDIGLHKDPKIAPVFLVWLVFSYALAYVLGILAYFVYRNLPSKNAEKADIEQGEPLQDLRGNSKIKGSSHRHTASSGSPFPVPRFTARGRMAGQDYEPKRKSQDGAAVYDDLAITPVKYVTTNVPKSPFDTHPNPLASSPIMAGPPPNFPSAAVLRAQASSYSIVSNYSRITRSTVASKNAGDPFNGTGMEIKSASSISLTSAHVREVSVAVARKDSLKKIKEATRRRGGY